MHGIELLTRSHEIRRRAQEALRARPGIMEFGVSRDYGSSSFLALLAQEQGARLKLVDPNAETLEKARQSLGDDFPCDAFEMPGEDVAQSDFLSVGVYHLDGFDIVTSHRHKQSTIAAYERIGLDLLRDGNVLSAKSHYLISEKIVNAADGAPTLVIFDDTWCTRGGIWMGKGATAVPYLIANGFVLVSSAQPPWWQPRKFKWGVALYAP